MATRCHEVVLAPGSLRGGQRNVVRDIQALHGECHDCGVLLPEEVVLRESFRPNDEVVREPGDRVLAPPALDRLAYRGPVVLFEQHEQRDLGYDVLLEGVLEQRRGREVQPKHEELRGHRRLVLPRLVYLRHRDLPLEAPRHDRLPLARLAACEVEVKRVQQPGEEIHRVRLDIDPKPPLAPLLDSQEELQGRDLPLEVPRVPHLSTELPELFQQQGGRPPTLASLAPQPEEEVPERLHPQQRMDDNVGVIRALDVVQSHHARKEVLAIKAPPPSGSLLVNPLHLLLRESRVENLLDVLQGPVNHLVPIRQAVHLSGLQVHEHAVLLLEGMRARVGLGSAALEVFAAHEAHVDVLLQQAHAATLLEVEVKPLPRDRVEVRALGSR
mmetsp:Transcript_13667/g.38493  ORF Transcript_13667/g.38493 Transcript_13667/m.38493 type:complete len:385 (+) Transcript_13667:1189-2343(+)